MRSVCSIGVELVQSLDKRYTTATIARVDSMKHAAECNICWWDKERKILGAMLPICCGEVMVPDKSQGAAPGIIWCTKCQDSTTMNSFRSTIVAQTVADPDRIKDLYKIGLDRQYTKSLEETQQQLEGVFGSGNVVEVKPDDIELPLCPHGCDPGKGEGNITAVLEPELHYHCSGCDANYQIWWKASPDDPPGVPDLAFITGKGLKCEEEGHSPKTEKSGTIRCERCEKILQASSVEEAILNGASILCPFGCIFVFEKETFLCDGTVQVWICECAEEDEEKHYLWIPLGDS